MKLLFDENLSFSLVGELAKEYPNSLHVRNVGLRGAEDTRIWAVRGYLYLRHQRIRASPAVALTAIASAACSRSLVVPGRRSR